MEFTKTILEERVCRVVYYTYAYILDPSWEIAKLIMQISITKIADKALWQTMPRIINEIYASQIKYNNTNTHRSLK